MPTQTEFNLQSPKMSNGISKPNKYSLKKISIRIVDTTKMITSVTISILISFIPIGTGIDPFTVFDPGNFQKFYYNHQKTSYSHSKRYWHR